MSDMPYQRVLPMSELQRKTEQAMVKRKESEGVPTEGVHDYIYNMSSATLDQVLRDLKRLPKLMVIDESTGESTEYRLANFKTEQDAIDFLNKIAKENQALFDYLTQYFHQGGFQNSSELLLKNHFNEGKKEEERLNFAISPNSRVATFIIKPNNVVSFKEEFEIAAITSMSDLTEHKNADKSSMAKVTCQSTLAFNDKGQVVQTYGDVKLSANHPKMREVFDEVAPLDIRNVIQIAQNALDEIKKTDPEYYEELTEKYKLDAKKIILYAKTFFEQSNRNNEYTSFDDFLAKHFSKPEGKEPIENYIGYLTGRQTYGVNTINAGSGMPIVSNILGIYRHGYIQFYDSPFANGQQPHNRQHEILELNPSAQTDEHGARTVIGQVKVVPGIVTMALHLSAKERLESGEYKLKNYRPWVNDCQTYLAHAQEGMNNILISVDRESGTALKQKVIDHYRFRPEISQKEAQWMRRQAGEHLNPKNEIFEMGKKGLHAKTVPVEPKFSDADLLLTNNFRNDVWDRKVKESPSKEMYRYVPWLMKQFARSIIDRTKKYAQYKVAEHSCKGHLRDLAKQLKKHERFMNEMPDTIMFDGINIPLKSEKQMKEIGTTYLDISELQKAILDHSSKMSEILIKLQKDPFNTNLNFELDKNKNEIIKNTQSLKKEIANLYAYMAQNNIKAPKEQKNCQDAIKDLQKYQNDLVNKCNSALSVGVKKQNKEINQPVAQVEPFILSLKNAAKKEHRNYRVVGGELKKSRTERPASGILSFSMLAPKGKGASQSKRHSAGDTPHPNKRQRVDKKPKN
jgi:hypothetical protein